MSEVIGKMIYCDRPGCNEKVFLAKTGEERLDGGFTVVDKYALKPEAWGWGWEAGIGKLCPACNKRYKEMLNEFKNEKQAEAVRDEESSRGGK